MLEAALTFTDRLQVNRVVFPHCVGSEDFYTNTKGSSSKTKPLFPGGQKVQRFYTWVEVDAVDFASLKVKLWATYLSSKVWSVRFPILFLYFKYICLFSKDALKTLHFPKKSISDKCWSFLNNSMNYEK